MKRILIISLVMGCSSLFSQDLQVLRVSNSTDTLLLLQTQNFGGDSGSTTDFVPVPAQGATTVSIPNDGTTYLIVGSRPTGANEAMTVLGYKELAKTPSFYGYWVSLHERTDTGLITVTSNPMPSPYPDDDPKLYILTAILIVVSFMWSFRSGVRDGRGI